MIKYEIEAQTQLTRQHIIGLLQKIKLCKAQADTDLPIEAITT